MENHFSYFSTKIYVVGTQKNPLNEMVLLSIQNTFYMMDKKIFTTFCPRFFSYLPGPMQVDMEERNSINNSVYPRNKKVIVTL